MSPISLYLAAAFVLPKIEVQNEYDLKQYYYRTRGWFFSFVSIPTLLDAIRRNIEGAPVTNIEVWSNLVAALIVGSLTYVRREWYHGLVTLAVGVLFLFFIIMEALQIG